MPTRIIGYERRTMAEALRIASEQLAEIYGTCPFDQYDWNGCPVFSGGGDANACKNQTARCWFAALQDKSFLAKKE